MRGGRSDWAGAARPYKTGPDRRGPRAEVTLSLFPLAHHCHGVRLRASADVDAPQEGSPNSARAWAATPVIPPAVDGGAKELAPADVDVQLYRRAVEGERQHERRLRVAPAYERVAHQGVGQVEQLGQVRDASSSCAETRSTLT